MKRFFPYIISAIALALAFGGMVYASTPAFTSFQLSTTTPSNGFVLQTDGSGNHWVATSTLGIVGGSGSPGGLNAQVQYNNAGSFGGVSGATTNGTILSLTNALLGGATLTTSSVNGVTLTSGGSATSYLNGAGAYSVPVGTTYTATSPITLSGNAFGLNSAILINAGTGISTTTGPSGSITVANTGVISLGNGTGTTCSGTSPGTCNVNTTQNITTLSNLTVAGFVQTTSGGVLSSAALTSGQVTTALGFTPGQGTVTAVSVASANGFAGTSSGGATPALTLSTSITGILKGNGTAISAATLGTDYVNGSGVNGNCVKWGASNSLADAGSACGSGGGTNFWTSLGGNIYNNTGARVQFPAFDATSTTATSTIANSLSIGSGTATPLVTISANGALPIYGYVPQDRLNIIDNVNDYSADNSYNNSNGNCATADKTEANNLNSTALNFNDQGHTSSAFTGVGCVNNPFTGFHGDSSYYFDPSGYMNFALGTTSPLVAFNWFGGGYTSANIIATLQENGNFGVGSSTPGTLFSLGNTGGINFSPIATSTFGSSANGINITNGCYAVNGTCLTSGGAGGLTGSTGQIAWFSSTNNAVGTSSIFINATNGDVGIGTTTAQTPLTVVSTISAPGLTSYSADFGENNTVLGYPGIQFSSHGVAGTFYNTVRDQTGIFQFYAATTTSEDLTNTKELLDFGASGLNFQDQLSGATVFSVLSALSAGATGIQVQTAATGGTTVIQETDTGANSGINLASKGTGSAILTSGTSNLTLTNAQLGLTVSGGSKFTIGTSQTTFSQAANSTATTIPYIYNGVANNSLTTTVGKTQFQFNFAQIQSHASGAIGANPDIRVTPTIETFTAGTSVANSTIASSTAFSVDSPPTQGAIVNFTNVQGIYIGTGVPYTASTTNAAGLVINGPSGATNNYAASTTGRFIMSGLGSGAGAGTVCQAATGEILFDSGAACVVSTILAKGNVHTITAQQANEVLDLRAVKYTYYDGSGTRYGFIANEVAKIDPDLVIYAQEDTPVVGAGGKTLIVKKGQPLSVDYMRYTGLLTAQVQLQEKQIQALGGGKPLRSVEENWQWLAIGLLALWNVYLTLKKK